MKNVIEIKNLKKNYPDFTLDIDKLNIPSGEVIGLIGENGAGKTTLIKLILNIINKESGDIKIFNKDLKDNEFSIKEDIGVVLPDFIPEKNCSLFGIFDGHGGNDVVKYIKNRLPEIIKTNITKNNDPIELCLSSSFHKIDEELKFYDSEHTGSTATILLIHMEDLQN